MLAWKNDISVLSFDADQTLCDFDKVMRQALQAVLAELNARRPDISHNLTVEKLKAIRDEVASEVKGQGFTHERIRRESLSRALALAGIHDNSLLDHLVGIYFEQRFQGTHLYDDVLPSLERLKKTHTLGVITNGNSYVERCGLSELFAFVVYAQDYGFEKPDQRLFKVAIKKSGHKPSSLLHIGDSLQKDVVGAQGAGARAVWMNRSSLANTTSIRPNLTISSLSELVDLLEPKSSLN